MARRQRGKITRQGRGFSLSVPLGDGTRHFETFVPTVDPDSAQGHEQAEAARLDLLKRLDAGELTKDGKALGVLFDAHAERQITLGVWNVDAAAKRVKHVSKRLHDSGLTIDSSAAEITAVYMDWLTTDGLSANTVGLYHKYLVTFFNELVADGVVSKSPMPQVKRPKPQPKQVRAMNPDELAKLIQAVERLSAVGHTGWFAAIVKLTLVVGCRSGEARALQWGDLKGSQLSITKNVQPDNSVKQTTKNGHDRHVTLDDETVAMLAEYKADCEARATAAGHTLTDDSLMFSATASFDRPIQRIGTRMHDLREALGITDLRFHDLRHQAVSHALGAGVPVPAATAYFGFSNPNVMLSTYAHALPDNADTVADMIRTSQGG